MANRDPQLLTQKQQIDIRFPAGFEPSFKPRETYTMVESATTYFEAYRWTLRALQELSVDAFPFKEYIVTWLIC